MRTQLDQIKETRLQLTKLSAASDSEIIEAAKNFANWAATLYIDERSKPVVRCTQVSSG